MQRHDVLVVGGGVAGFAAARALRNVSPATSVHHVGGRAPDLTVIFWPRGQRALQRLTHGSEPPGQRLASLRYSTSDIAPLGQADVGERTRLVAQQQIQDLLPGLYTDKVVTHLRRVPRGHIYQVGKQPFFASVVVGADGIQSLVRRTVFGSEAHTESGQIVVGSLRAKNPTPFGRDAHIDMFFGESAFLGVLPQLDRDGKQVGINWWLFTSAGPFHGFGAASLSRKDCDEWRRRLAPVIEQFAPPVSLMFEHTEAFYARPVRPWLHPAMAAGTDRVAFVGDAWRAATPELGLGVTWALEDAVRLGDSVAEHGLVRGTAHYVRTSSATACESLLGRSFSQHVARPNTGWLRRAIAAGGMGPQLAVHGLTACR